MSTFGRKPRAEPILLNIYDLSPGNEWLAPLGLGFFHSGLVVHGREYTFASGSGIFSHTPKAPPEGSTPGTAPPFRFSIELGAVEATSSEVQRTVEALRGAWPGESYHVLSKNCNDFASELSIRLCGRPIPGWVNRTAAIGSYFSCILPVHMRPPPGEPGARGARGGSGGGDGASASGGAAVAVVRRAAPAAAASSSRAPPRAPSAAAAAAEARARELRVAAVLKRQAAAAAEAVAVPAGAGDAGAPAPATGAEKGGAAERRDSAAGLLAAPE
jgi:hypothetical protein